MAARGEAWEVGGKSIGFRRKGVFYVRKWFDGKQREVSTRCDDETEALAFWMRFRENP